MKNDKKSAALRRELALLVGEAVASLRLKAGLTQEDLAHRLGIGAEALSRIERGAALPPLDRIYAIARALKCGAAPMLLAGATHPSDDAILVLSMMDGLNELSRKRVAEAAKHIADFERAHAGKG